MATGIDVGARLRVSSLKKVLDGFPMLLAEFFTLDLSATPQVFFASYFRGSRR